MLLDFQHFFIITSSSGLGDNLERKNDNYVTIEKDGNQIVDYVLPEEAGVYPGQGDTQRMFCSTCIFSSSSPGFLL